MMCLGLVSFMFIELFGSVSISFPPMWNRFSDDFFKYIFLLPSLILRGLQFTCVRLLDIISRFTGVPLIYFYSFRAFQVHGHFFCRV